MSDHSVPLDVASQAAHIVELRSEQRALAEKVAADGQATRDALSSIQSDIKTVVGKFAEIINLEHHHNANTVAIKSLQQQVENVGIRLERWVETTEREYEHKWNEAIKDRDRWRRDHEAENRRDRETLIRWGGVALGVSLLAGTVVAMFQWNLALRFQYIEDRQARQETVGTANRGLIENLQDGQSEIKLKLVRMEKSNGNDTNSPP